MNRRIPLRRTPRLILRREPRLPAPPPRPGKGGGKDDA